MVECQLRKFIPVSLKGGAFWTQGPLSLVSHRKNRSHVSHRKNRNIGRSFLNGSNDAPWPMIQAAGWSQPLTMIVDPSERSFLFTPVRDQLTGLRFHTHSTVQRLSTEKQVCFWFLCFLLVWVIKLVGRCCFAVLSEGVFLPKVFPSSRLRKNDNAKVSPVLRRLYWGQTRETKAFLLTALA